LPQFWGPLQSVTLAFWPINKETALCGCVPLFFLLAASNRKRTLSTLPSTIVPLLARSTCASGSADRCSGPGSQSNPGNGHIMIGHTLIIFIAPAHRLGVALLEVCPKYVPINRSSMS
jgi:hypothetical protein